MAYLSVADSMIREIPSDEELEAAGVPASQVISVDFATWVKRVNECDGEIVPRRTLVGRVRRSSMQHGL